MKKISNWLAGLDPWSIYLSDKMKESFLKETGQEPVWPEHVHQQTAKAMAARGLGGTLGPPHPGKECWGYEMAIALAEKYVDGFLCTKMGRGFAFQEALEALRKVGM